MRLEPAELLDAGEDVERLLERHAELELSPAVVDILWALDDALNGRPRAA